MKKLLLLLPIIIFIDMCGMDKQIQRFDSTKAIAHMSAAGCFSSGNQNVFHTLSKIDQDENALIDIARACYENGTTDVDLKRMSDDKTPIECAVDAHKNAYAHWLAQTRNQSSFHKAITDKNIEVLYPLLSRGVDPLIRNQEDETAMTSIIHSSFNNRPSMNGKIMHGGSKSWFLTKYTMQLLSSFMSKEALTKEYDYALELMSNQSVPEKNKKDFQNNVIQVLSHAQSQADKGTQQDQVARLVKKNDDSIIRSIKKSRNDDKRAEKLVGQVITQRAKLQSGNLRASGRARETLNQLQEELSEAGLTQDDILEYRDLQREKIKKEMQSQDSSLFSVVVSLNGVEDRKEKPLVMTFPKSVVEQALGLSNQQQESEVKEPLVVTFPKRLVKDVIESSKRTRTPVVKDDANKRRRLDRSTK